MHPSKINYAVYDVGLYGVGTITVEALDSEYFFQKGSRIARVLNRKYNDGSNIIEGDIVMGNTSYCADEPGVVWWDDERCGFYVLKSLVGSGSEHIRLPSGNYAGRYKINGAKWAKIGNIYENFGLLSDDRLAGVREILIKQYEL